jgi:hypothetical protein
MRDIMNPIKTFLFTLLAAAFTGCASRSTVVVTQPVGPGLAPPHPRPTHQQGQLVVYSAFETVDPVSSDFPTHAAYEIEDSHGHLVRRVDNRSGPFYQSPAAVSLPAGEYEIKALATNRGLVTVPVIIQANETTTLDLDGTHFPQHKPTGAGQWVRLPTGEVIGMRSP